MAIYLKLCVAILYVFLFYGALLPQDLIPDSLEEMAEFRLDFESGYDKGPSVAVVFS
ncbi:MAG: hypothetical protein IH851_06380 [Armatimonadetes bacterium]|nr:hypothetical protein [Armatimonadota bacterium]